MGYMCTFARKFLSNLSIERAPKLLPPCQPREMRSPPSGRQMTKRLRWISKGQSTVGRLALILGGNSPLFGSEDGPEMDIEAAVKVRGEVKRGKREVRSGKAEVGVKRGKMEVGQDSKGWRSFKPDNLPWVEKYRPKHLEDLISQDDKLAT
eukprot:1372099-Amorphochlora_amoeboformis.AAC.2